MTSKKKHGFYSFVYQFVLVRSWVHPVPPMHAARHTAYVPARYRVTGGGRYLYYCFFPPSDPRFVGRRNDIIYERPTTTTRVVKAINDPTGRPREIYARLRPVITPLSRSPPPTCTPGRRRVCTGLPPVPAR